MTQGVGVDLTRPAAEQPPPAAPAASVSLLDTLVAEVTAIQARHERDTIDLPVAGRPTHVVRYRTSLNYEQLQTWVTQARDPEMPSGVNLLEVAAQGLAHQCAAILFNGERLVDGKGHPVTFGSTSLQELLDVDGAIAAVKKFYVDDYATLGAWRALTAPKAIDVLGGERQADPTQAGSLPES